ncbi:glycosyltransferase family 39 protein [Rhodococcus rhodochrous]|nr:glycosyltransferase family 39 protein [Rhodococcus rhodochrous]
MAWARTAQERTVAHEAPQRRVIHPFAGRAVGVIAALVAVAHLVAAVAGGRGYWFDEMYMLAVGRNHLDWGSADQPPVAPLIAWTADAVAPGSIVALRLPAIVATVAAVVVVALIARELGGDGRAQWIAAAAQATSVSAALFGHWLTPYALEPVQWLVLLWLLVRWVRVRHGALTPVLGHAESSICWGSEMIFSHVTKELLGGVPAPGGRVVRVHAGRDDPRYRR